MVNAGAIAGLATVMLVMLLGQSRVFYSMAHDGLLPEVGGRHPSQVPDAVDIHGRDRYSRGLFRLAGAHWRPRRAGYYRHPDGLHHRLRRSLGDAPQATRRASAVQDAVDALGTVDGHHHLPRLDAGLNRVTWIRLFVWLIIGMVIYFTYGRHHSKVQNMASEEVKVAGD